MLAAATVTVQGVPWAFDGRLPCVLSFVYLAVFGSVIAFGVPSRC
jgi:hypothetical protein